MTSSRILVTCECAPNIALIKYWGKADEELVLPLNDSLSITLDKNVLNSKTSLMLLAPTDSCIDKESKKIQIWFGTLKQEFNEEIESKDQSKSKELISKKRFLSMLDKVRENCGLAEPSSYHIRIKTLNNFPTGCGLASSASGFACLALCLANAFKYNGDISELARLGSGSACRSCLGGFVKWSASDLSSLSIANQLFPTSHWPNLNVLALILEDGQKSVSSTHGMKESVATSELNKYRVKIVKETRMHDIEKAIERRDFNQVGKLAIKDSNCFHAICLDTYPPLFYLNEKSKQIIRMIDTFNAFERTSDDDLKAFYSFDAGPNAFLFVLDQNLDELLYLIHRIYFHNLDNKEFEAVINKQEESFSFSKNHLTNERKTLLDKHFTGFNGSNKQDSIIKYLIHSKVGENPAVYLDDWTKSLLDKNGQPW